MANEVSHDARMKMGHRLMRAAWHFEETHNERARSKAVNLGEKIGGLQVHVTEYDMFAANEWLNSHGLRDEAAGQAVEDEWSDKK
ncbi:hypothetical protein [Burkholderia stagnalis]|uniref:hypothetical protein n=1 Tax=Burkholderia stagnalis TaxID=1503054 RepID=UPI00325C16A9